MRNKRTAKVTITYTFEPIIKEATITKVNFIRWYFEHGEDGEIQEGFENFGKMVVSKLFDKEFNSDTLIQELWDNCNKELIFCCFLEEFTDDNHDLIEEYDIEKITLID